MLVKMSTFEGADFGKSRYMQVIMVEVGEPLVAHKKPS